MPDISYIFTASYFTNKKTEAQRSQLPYVAQPVNGRAVIYSQDHPISNPGLFPWHHNTLVNCDSKPSITCLNFPFQSQLYLHRLTHWSPRYFPHLSNGLDVYACVWMCVYLYECLATCIYMYVGFMTYICIVLYIYSDMYMYREYSAYVFVMYVVHVNAFINVCVWDECLHVSTCIYSSDWGEFDKYFTKSHCT